MKQAFFLAPSGTGVGLTTVSLRLVNALDSHGVRVAYFKPISQRADDALGVDRSTHCIRATTTLQPRDPIPFASAGELISDGRLDELLVQVIAGFNESTPAADIVVIEGLRATRGDPQLGNLNQNVLSIGPMLQGLRRPVNDLSRGALVKDIVYTIALTAIQATQV
jgi:phosphate acetyltransferase